MPTTIITSLENDETFMDTRAVYVRDILDLITTCGADPNDWPQYWDWDEDE